MALYDWDYWRHKYVSGDDSVTLEWPSKLPNSPVFGTLKNRASQESWAKQRENYRLQKMTLVTTDPAAIQAAEQVSKLVDMAEMITRQSSIAKGFQVLAARWLKQANPEDLDGNKAIAMFRDAAKVEQLLAGLATEHSKTEIDVTKLSDAELDRIIRNK